MKMKCVTTLHSHFGAQIQLADTKKQLETQVALHQKTKEMLDAAELELRNLRMVQSSMEPRHVLSSPSATRVRGWYNHRIVNLPSQEPMSYMQHRNVKHSSLWGNNT